MKTLYKQKMTQIFLLIPMIIGSETPACHMNDTQHNPHKRENTENTPTLPHSCVPLSLLHHKHFSAC